MKKMVLEFFHRGLVACGFGPIVLAVIYLILQKSGAMQTLSVNQVCLGIFSLSGLAFIVGGMNIIYQFERLPLMLAILIHGVVLYFSYLGTFLINGWLDFGRTPIFIFTGIFILGYLAIWAIIYTLTIRNTRKLNKILMEKQNEGCD